MALFAIKGNQHVLGLYWISQFGDVLGHTWAILGMVCIAKIGAFSCVADHRYDGDSVDISSIQG